MELKTFTTIHGILNQSAVFWLVPLQQSLRVAGPPPQRNRGIRSRVPLSGWDEDPFQLTPLPTRRWARGASGWTITRAFDSLGPR
jgi:hypothetical protein